MTHKRSKYLQFGLGNELLKLFLNKWRYHLEIGCIAYSVPNIGGLEYGRTARHTLRQILHIKLSTLSSSLLLTYTLHVRICTLFKRGALTALQS